MELISYSFDLIVCCKLFFHVLDEFSGPCTVGYSETTLSFLVVFFLLIFLFVCFVCFSLQNQKVDFGKNECLLPVCILNLTVFGQSFVDWIPYTYRKCNY